MPEELLDRQSLLVGRLSLSAASSGTELAYKAYVLRDLLVADDMIGTLTMSLCHDTERLFPTAPVFSTGYLRDQMALPISMSSLSLEDLMKLARLFTN